MLSDFTATANAIAATTKKGEKERLLASYLAALDDQSLERAAVFFTGAAFPRRDQRVTGAGAATIGDAVIEVTGRTAEELRDAWPRYADFGDCVAELFENLPKDSRDISLPELGAVFEAMAETQNPAGKRSLLAALLRRVDAQGARYISKILLNEFRIGLQEGLVEAAIARAFGSTTAAVRRANMFTGDIGATALLARAGTLESAQMTLFHPFGFMLAQPEESAAGILNTLGAGALADDKYDGIRAQIHSDGRDVRIYSRTLDDITVRFPEVASAALGLRAGVILDGELVAFRDRILPFAVIQKRLGRRTVSEKLLADAPVVFFAFDLLAFEGRPLFDVPLAERLELLRGIVSGTTIRLSDQSVVRDAAHLEELFDAARARANEGLVIKDPQSLYTPGRRGKSWLKYKKALATLDCVVVYAQYGNGKRRSVLSDLTFAVRKGDELVTIGKAYSGLTDVEIAAMTEQIRATGEDLGWGFRARPEIVLEIAFDRIQESARHKSGYALRFPRIARIRDDKSVDEISTIDEVRRVYEGQLLREEGVEGGS